MPSDSRNLLETVWSYLAFALMLIGIVGLSFQFFRDDGWAEQIIGRVWEAETRNPLLMTPVILGGAWVLLLFFRGGLVVGKGHPLSDLFVYLLMAAGAWFLFQWLSGSVA